MQRGRQHFGRRVEHADAAAFELGGILRVEQKAPGVVGHWHVAQSGFDLVDIDAHRDIAPEPVDQMLVARVDLGQLLEQSLVQVAPVAELAAIELLQQAAFDLRLGKVRSGHDDVIAGLACDQLGVQHLVGIVVVVADLDAGFFFEVLDRVFGDVVGPVVNIQHLGVGRPHRTRSQHGGGCKH